MIEEIIVYDREKKKGYIAVSLIERATCDL